MEEKREILDPEQRAEMYDLCEALVDFVGEKDVSINVIMHALCRTLAYGGVQMKHCDKMTKNQFVANVVEAVSAHYEVLEIAIKLSEEHDD